ncbi:MAG: hypothetical protein ACRD3W_09765, partial [Terriglobales bacterium]
NDQSLLQKALPHGLSFESMSWLLPVLSSDSKSSIQSEAIRNILASQLSETSSTANVQEPLYGEGSYLLFFSQNRLTAVLLEAFIEDQPDNDIIPKLVKALQLSRKNGCWFNTQENAYSLSALSKYFETYEKAEPNFKASFWLDKLYIEDKFIGREIATRDLKIPMEFLQSQVHDNTLTIEKRGAGRLYYRIGMKYAPKQLKLAEKFRGFRVYRTYEAVDHPADVVRGNDGLHVKAGAIVKVTLKIDTPGTRYHVALVDPLPAGFEAIIQSTLGNRQLPGRSNPYATHRYYFGWEQSWYEHENMRDNRAEVFSSRLSAGHHEFVYFARATTPGRFIVPPFKAEEMYTPETFGRTATDQVTIY